MKVLSIVVEEQLADELLTVSRETGIPPLTLAANAMRLGLLVRARAKAHLAAVVERHEEPEASGGRGQEAEVAEQECPPQRQRRHDGEGQVDDARERGRDRGEEQRTAGQRSDVGRSCGRQLDRRDGRQALG